jgi:quercetin dioxygenase-like cupin family protein
MNRTPPLPPHNENRVQLDEDIESAIARSLMKSIAPETESQAIINRTRSRLLNAIAAANGDAHTTVHAHENTWRALLDNIEFKLLHHVDGVASYLLRMQPGAVLPAHRHPVDEECVVLEGELRIGQTLTLKAGSFHFARKEMPHAHITTDGGALIFLRGAIPSATHMI